MNNRKISLTGAITASAQSMGNEGGGYWCDDEEIGRFLSAVPCDDVCVTVCTLCHESLPCNEEQSHVCGTTDDNDDYNGNYWNNRDDEDFFGETNGGGGSGGGGGTGSSSTGTLNIKKLTPAKITSAAESVVKSIPGLDAQCSQGVRKMFKTLFGTLPAGMNCQANEMVKYWIGNSSWHEISLSQTQSLANQGYFVVAGWINPDPNDYGHVVVIVPGKESYSKKWKCMVPQAMDTGSKKRNASQMLSDSFSPTKKPTVRYFVYK